MFEKWRYVQKMEVCSSVYYWALFRRIEVLDEGNLYKAYHRGKLTGEEGLTHVVDLLH